MFNRVILVGKINSDIRYNVIDGTQYIDFILECRRTFGESNNKKLEIVNVKVLSWGYNADICKNKLKKGSIVLVEGGLKYDNKDKIHYIGAWNIVFLDKSVYNNEMHSKEPNLDPVVSLTTFLNEKRV